jgi:hypothetical protein
MAQAFSADLRYELEKLTQDESTGELRVARTAVSILFKSSDDVINLLLSADHPETTYTTAEQLLKALKQICEHLTKLQPDVLRLIGTVLCLESTESINLMYKFHNEYFLSKLTNL